jgi:hypothetical protein
LQVLRGATQFLKRSGYPPLLLEVWNQDWFAERKKELLEFIEALGYGLFCMGEDVIAQHPAHPRRVRFALVDNVISMERVT